MKFKFPREFYIPKGAVKVADKKSDAVAYLYSRTTAFGERHSVLIFFGKQAKPASHYTYKSMAVREDFVKQSFAGRQASQAYKAGRMAERKAFVHDYKVGEILRTSWGYDQTNVEFFQITEVKGKMLTLREIASTYVATGSMSGNTSPLPGKFLTPRYEGDDQGLPIKRLAQKEHVKICDVRSAWRIAPQADGSYASSYTSSYH